MNENLNLVEILKDCPKGTKLYSSVFGMVELDHINIRTNYPIVIKLKGTEGYESLTSERKMCVAYVGECHLSPSREVRDWCKFMLKKSKFDPQTLQAFDKVLVKMGNESYNTWYADFIAEPAHAKNETPLILGAKEANMVIPYNDNTKHLVGTAKEAPEFYRYWED